MELQEPLNGTRKAETFRGMCYADLVCFVDSEDGVRN